MVGAVVAEAGDGGIDDGRIDLAQLLIAQAQAVHNAGTVILQNHVALGHQLAEHLFTGLALEVQDDAALVAVEVHIIGAFAVDNGKVAAGVIALAGTLDLDDLGAQICQHHAAVRGGKHAGQIQHLHAGQQTFMLHSVYSFFCAGAPVRFA